MRSWLLAAVLLLTLSVNAFCSDVIVMKTGVRIEGTLIKKTKDKWAFRRMDGSLSILETKDIAQFIRDNIIFDLEKRIQFVVQKRRPFLPFLVLSAGTGYYAVKKFQDYGVHKQEAADEKEEFGLDRNYQNLNDQSKKDMAYGIISGLFCAGSIYIALRPVEVKTAMGAFNLTVTPTRVNFALHF